MASRPKVNTKYVPTEPTIVYPKLTAEKRTYFIQRDTCAILSLADLV